MAFVFKNWFTPFAGKRVNEAAFYWNLGVLEFDDKTLTRANSRASTWAKWVPELPDMDGQGFFEITPIYGCIAHKEFWDALLKRYSREPLGMWHLMADRAIHSGNTIALDALSTVATRQTWFYHWYGALDHQKNVMHPQSLRWFLQDPALEKPLQALAPKLVNENVLSLMYWDAAHQRFGAAGMHSFLVDWSRLPEPWCTAQLAFDACLLVGLFAHNLKECMPWVRPSFEALCTATALDVSLVRVMTQLMTEQDYEDPHLAALSLYMHGPEGVSRPSYPWVLTSPRGRQLQENASRASVTSQLLELQRPTSPTDIYALMHNILHPNAPHALVENQVTNTSSSVDFTMC